MEDFHAVIPGIGLGDFHHLVGDVHRKLIDFNHGVVVHRRFSLLHFCSVSLILLLVVLGSGGSCWN